MAIYSLVISPAIFFSFLPSAFLLIEFTDNNYFSVHFSFNIIRLNIRIFLNLSSSFGQ